MPGCPSQKGPQCYARCGSNCGDIKEADLPKLRLLIDMDDVTVSMADKIVYLYNERYKEYLTYEDLVHTDFSDAVPKDRAESVWGFFNAPGFFSDLRPVEGAIESIKRLHDAGHEIIFVSVCPRMSTTAAYDKTVWLARHFPFLEQIRRHVVFSKNKSLVLGHILFDDGPHNIKEVMEAGGLTCVMDRPWNQEVKGTFRAKTWLDFEKVVRHLQIIAARS